MDSETTTLRYPASRQRLKLISILVLAFILVIAGFGWVYVTNLRSDDAVKIEALSEANATLQAQLTVQQTESAGQASRLQLAADALGSIAATSASQEAVSGQAQATQAALQAENDRLTASNAWYIAQLQDAQGKMLEIQSALSCVNASYFKADYASNAKMSEALKTYVGDIGGSYASASFSLIWPGSAAAIHRIVVTQDHHVFINVFIVYFEEKDFSTPGVFWVNRSCWLDRK